MHSGTEVAAGTLHSPVVRPPTKLCLLYALAAALAVFAWQSATVHFNFGGNWTALFMTGDSHPAPPELDAGTYYFKASTGYDGQFYRYVAHAPWFRKDWAQYFDAPRMRQFRILIPGMAWLLAAGQDSFVDAAYIAVVLGWVFLGVYWLALYAVEEAHDAAWGLTFLLLPATITSIDRMTVDVALAALCVAFARYAKKQPGRSLYLVLTLAPLVRDAGALLIAAQCGYHLLRKRWRRAAVFATAILPIAAWFVYVRMRIPLLITARRHDSMLLPHWLFQYPGIGIVIRLFRPTGYPFAPWVERTVQIADAVALCAFLSLLGAAAWALRRRPWDPTQWAALGFIGLALSTSAPVFWGNVYTYARPFTPLIFFAAILSLRNGARWVLVPVALITIRTLMQLEPQAVGILHGIF